MMRILIDADGCPVVDAAVALAREYGIPCLILCDTSHQIERKGARTLVCSKGADSVDFTLVNLLRPGDIAVTQDYGLAALCLALHRRQHRRAAARPAHRQKNPRGGRTAEGAPAARGRAGRGIRPGAARAARGGDGMKAEFFSLPSGIPAVLYGASERCVWLYLHGQCGQKEEAERFAALVCPRGEGVLAVDLPEHGARRERPERLVPWQVAPELRQLLRYARSRWPEIRLRAVSLGAFFALLAFGEERLAQALFSSGTGALLLPGDRSGAAHFGTDAKGRGGRGGAQSVG